MFYLFLLPTISNMRWQIKSLPFDDICHLHDKRMKSSFYHEYILNYCKTTQMFPKQKYNHLLLHTNSSYCLISTSNYNFTFSFSPNFLKIPFYTSYILWDSLYLCKIFFFQSWDFYHFSRHFSILHQQQHSWSITHICCKNPLSLYAI